MIKAKTIEQWKYLPKGVVGEPPVGILDTR